MTSSPSTVTFSMRTLGGGARPCQQDGHSHPFPSGPAQSLTHWPTRQRQPTMQDSSQEWERMWASRSTVHRRIHTPSSTTTPGPRLTLGPMLQFLPMRALGSTSTLPTMPGPEHSCSGCFCRNDCRKRHMPVRKSLGCPMSIQKPIGRECIRELSPATDHPNPVASLPHPATPWHRAAPPWP